MKTKSLILLLFTLLSSAASALTFNVTVLTDGVDSNPGDGICEVSVGSGQCSLRAAVMEANALGGGIHTIELGASIYELTLLGEDDSALAGDIDILSADITINGSGLDTVINGNSNNRLFDVFNGRTFTLNNLTITGGRAATALQNGGGAIQVSHPGTQLFTNHVVITNNSANVGGALSASFGTDINLFNTTFIDNFTEDLGFTNIFGPAIYCSGCEMVITGSTLTGNDMGGKAIQITGDGYLAMTNSTMTDNEGGAIRTENGNAKIRFSTFVSGTGQNFSHFSFDDTHVVDIGSSILKTLDGSFLDNCQAGDKPISSGYNIVSDSSCEFSAVGDSEMTDALLADITDNGGPTETFLPAINSPAIDLVPINLCFSSGNDPLEFDQRGKFRPDGNFCDSGAVELNLDVIFRDDFDILE
jgi:hypothetical protein